MALSPSVFVTFALVSASPGPGERQERKFVEGLQALGLSVLWTAEGMKSFLLAFVSVVILDMPLSPGQSCLGPAHNIIPKLGHGGDIGPIVSKYRTERQSGVYGGQPEPRAPPLSCGPLWLLGASYLFFQHQKISEVSLSHGRFQFCPRCQSHIPSTVGRPLGWIQRIPCLSRGSRKTIPHGHVTRKRGGLILKLQMMDLTCP